MSYVALGLALLSALFAALVAIFGKIGLAGINSTLATSVRSLVMSAFFILVLIFNRQLLAGLTNFDRKAWIFIVLSGLAGALSWLSYFAALKIGRTTTVAALDRMSVVMVWIFAIIFLQETFKWSTLAGVLLMSVGAALTIL